MRCFYTPVQAHSKSSTKSFHLGVRGSTCLQHNVRPRLTEGQPLAARELLLSFCRRHASVSWLSRGEVDNAEVRRLRVSDRNLVAGDIVARADAPLGQVQSRFTI